MKPKLVHPVIVEILNIDNENSEYDKDFEEPVKVQYAKPVKLKAQVKYYNFARVDPGVTGFEKRGDGYLLIHREDAYLIEENAQIIKIDGEKVLFYVNETLPAGHYSNSCLRKVFFQSKPKGANS